MDKLADFETELPFYIPLPKEIPDNGISLNNDPLLKQRLKELLVGIEEVLGETKNIYQILAFRGQAIKQISDSIIGIEDAYCKLVFLVQEDN